MISFVIKFITIVFVIVSVCTFEKKKSIIERIFKAIKNAYYELVNQQGPILKFLLKFVGIMLLMVFYLISFQKCCLLDGRTVSIKSIAISVLIWIITLLIMYFGFGCVLAIFSKTVELIGDVKDRKIGIKMMCSFLLLTLLAFFSFIAEKEMRDNLFFLFVGLVSCYILNIQILIKIVKNPFCIIEDKNKQESKNRVLILFTSLLIVLMIILNMYLLVLWTYFSFDGAYNCSSGSISKWNLLYYTIISFTTIGYGDICPTTVESQAVAILISITSVICLIIFVSSLLSAKNDILGNKEKEE